MAGLPKHERKEIRTRLKAILNTYRNSAVKHLKNQNMERLQWRINKTLEALKQPAKELAEEDLTTTAKLIRNSANYTLTFARPAAKRVRVPYTNNLIERVMEEIAKRVNNKWTHWSIQRWKIYLTYYSPDTATKNATTSSSNNTYTKTIYPFT